MKRLSAIAAVAAASMLLVGCQAEKELAVKQEPWATPKGDVRVDCAVYQTKYERWSSALDSVQRERDKSLDKHQSIRYESGNQAAQEWWASSENRLPITEKRENRLSKELDIAKINVAKHLGYSDLRLEEMWEWRSGDGPSWKASNKDDKLPFMDRIGEQIDKGFPYNEFSSFCEKL